jgi:UDP-glucose 4-epimerase
MIKMGRYLVTGGAGFIGSHITEKLLSMGHYVTVFDNFSTGNLKFLSISKEYEKFTLINGNLLNSDLIEKSLKDIDVVYHMAANADI